MHKRFRVVDAANETWHVLPGDPAHALCARLDTLKWEPRLPASVLITGAITDADIQAAEAQLDSLTAEQPPEMLALLAQAILDSYRTYRQLVVLRGGRA